jgi:hypothetical protein
MKHIKFAALALVAIFVMSAAGATAASAAEYNVKNATVTATGENHKFTAGKATITCKEATFTVKETVGKHKTIKATPAYKTCEVGAPINAAATVTVTKCQYEFLEPKGAGPFTGGVNIIGGETCVIKITVTIAGVKCEVKFKEQAIPGEGVTFTNNEAKTGGTINAKVEGVKYTSNNKCLGFVEKEGANGVYEGTAKEEGIVVE